MRKLFPLSVARCLSLPVLGHCGNDPEMTYAMTCTGCQTTLRPDFKLPEKVGR